MLKWFKSITLNHSAISIYTLRLEHPTEKEEHNKFTYIDAFSRGVMMTEHQVWNCFKEFSLNIIIIGQTVSDPPGGPPWPTCGCHTPCYWSEDAKEPDIHWSQQEQQSNESWPKLYSSSVSWEIIPSFDWLIQFLLSSYCWQEFTGDDDAGNKEWSWWEYGVWLHVVTSLSSAEHQPWGGNIN